MREMTTTPEPLLVPALHAFAMIGVRPTKGWEIVKDGRLAARKLGSRTMIETASIRAFVAALPAAREAA
ncbi:hypothetical protein [Falsiroseomonas tokyonensis]|uniref:DNA-binding protein n=1 Tax=Falsiroseomonas tokyonensis TaxID=430521 RepID=A0ABV7C1M2_9PROT|nr:hypothetical protein [Falsiroseomonas tokyonensis]MBU8541603.1 hypothetical protein [Falsiroseomonas tokyonensis]